MSNLQIHTTTDYTKFSFFPENRNIRPRHVEKLIKVLRHENRMHLHPIIVQQIGDNLFVKDGQHRYEACKSLNIPIHYLLDDSVKKDTMILDQTQESWDLQDRLHYYVTLGHEEYIKFSSLMKNYEIPFSTLFALLGAHKFQHGKAFKGGTLKVNYKIEAFVMDTHKMRKHVTNQYPLKKYVLNRRDFICSLYWFYKRYEPNRFNHLLEQLVNKICDVPEKASRNTYEHFLINLCNSVKGGFKTHLMHPETLAKKERDDETDD